MWSADCAPHVLPALIGWPNAFGVGRDAAEKGWALGGEAAGLHRLRLYTVWMLQRLSAGARLVV